jgi:hypothetical protein
VDTKQGPPQERNKVKYNDRICKAGMCRPSAIPLVKEDEGACPSCLVPQAVTLSQHQYLLHHSFCSAIIFTFALVIPLPVL